MPSNPDDKTPAKKPTPSRETDSGRRQGDSLGNDRDRKERSEFESERFKRDFHSPRETPCEAERRDIFPVRDDSTRDL